MATKKKVLNWTDTTGLCRLWLREIGKGKNATTVYSTSIGRKSGEGKKEKWANVYFDVFFPKDAEKPEAVKDEDATWIFIKSGFLTVSTGSDGVNRPAIYVSEWEEPSEDEIPF